MLHLLLLALSPAALAQDANCTGTTCPLVDELSEALEEDGGFDVFNDPSEMEPDYERRLDELPLSGRADVTPWTDTYWPKAHGGIANRWQTGEERGYAMHGREALFEMSEAEIALLSPAEKYDLLVGNYQYALTYRGQAESGEDEPSWAGFCHGWTLASMHYDEPRPVVMTNPDGLRIPFGSSDVKALLTYFSGEVVRNTHYPAESMPWASAPRGFGTLCVSNNPDAPECQDTNPGAFHIALANQLGIRGEAFGIDATNTNEKWNQPVHAFDSEIIGWRAPSPGASPLAVEEKIVQTDVTWTAEVEAEWEPLLGTDGHEDATVRYTYTLELDRQGEIVGGQWAVRLEGGQLVTYQEVLDHLQGVDEDGDGVADLSEEEVRGVVWELFSFPDYVWNQDRMPFSETFRPAQGPYDFLTNSRTTREGLFHYMSELGALYEASTAGEG